MKILIVDDHELIADGLRHLLQSHGFEVLGIAPDGQAGVERSLAWSPDLVLMDIRMPRIDGLAATRLIKAQRPDIKIVILTVSADDSDLFEAVKSGASGYLLKSTRSAAFLEALHGLEEGTPPFSPGLATLLLREFSHLAEKTTYSQSEKFDPPLLEPVGSRKEEKKKVPLTERQVEVLRLIASGLTYKEVGVKLAISHETVRYHMREIMDALHLENRSQVIAYAGKLNLQ